MGLKYSQSTMNAQIRALTSASREFKGMIADEMETIKEPIIETMRLYSDLKKNQISHDMINAFDAEVSRTATQLRFGFIKDFQDYYKFQTITGFTQWNSGKFIEPSLAIADAKIDATELMHEAAIRIRKNFMARLGRR